MDRAYGCQAWGKVNLLLKSIKMNFSWKFGAKYWEFVFLKNLFFWVLASSSRKSVKVFWVATSKDGSKFWWLPILVFPAINNICAKIHRTVYHRFFFSLSLLFSKTSWFFLSISILFKHEVFRCLLVHTSKPIFKRHKHFTWV